MHITRKYILKTPLCNINISLQILLHHILFLKKFQKQRMQILSPYSARVEITEIKGQRLPKPVSN